MRRKQGLKKMVTNDQLHAALQAVTTESQRRWIEVKHKMEEHYRTCDLLAKRFEVFYDSYILQRDKERNTVWKRMIKWFKS